MYETNFETIMLHLNRKRGDKVIRTAERAAYATLECDYECYHLTVTYQPNPGIYNVHLEDTRPAFTKRQKPRKTFWEKNVNSQSEVIEYIRDKMRKPKD